MSKFVQKKISIVHIFSKKNFKKLFFQVWKAEAENICGYDGTVLVAVKTTKDKAPDKEKSGTNLFTFLFTFYQLFVYIFLFTFSDLLQEMQIMQKIGHHPNVVTLLGVSIDKGNVHCIFTTIFKFSRPKNLFFFF